MDIKRTVLWVIFFMSAVMLFDNWQRDHGRPSMFFPSADADQDAGSAAPGTTTPGTQSADLPAASDRHAAPGTTAPAATQAQLVKFTTDVYCGEIDTRGGTLSKLSLVKQGDGKQPDLVHHAVRPHRDPHVSGAHGPARRRFPESQRRLHAGAGPARRLTGDAKTLSIAFESPVKGGVKVIKTYTFTRGSYVIDVDTKIQNVGTTPVTPTLYMELVRDDQPVETPRFSHTFIGPAVYTDQHHFQKIDVQRHRQEQGRTYATVRRQRLDRDGPALLRVGVDSAAGREARHLRARRSIRRCIAWACSSRCRRSRRDRPSTCTRACSPVRKKSACSKASRRVWNW